VPVTKYRWFVLAAATIVQATSGFAFIGVGTLAGFFREEFSLTDTETGLIVTAVGLVPVFALIPVGRLLDRHGERGIVSGGALILASGVGLAALAPSYPALLVLLLLGGSGYATSQPGGSKAVATWFSAHRRGLAMGIRQTGLPLGGAAAAAILPALATSAGWQSAMITAALVTSGGGVIFLAVYRRAATEGASEYRLIPQLRQLVRDPRFRPFLWVGLLMVGTQFSIVSFLMLYLRDVHSIPLASAAWFLFAAQMAGVAGRIVLAGWSDRLGSGRRMQPVLVSLISVSLLAFVLPLFPQDSSEAVLAVAAAVMGFFAFGWYGPWVVHVAETASVGAIGLTLGVAMTANQIGIAVAPPVFGLLLDLSGGYTIPWWFLSLVLLIGGVKVYAAIRRGHG
jgi:predicted MFS family arabinose efflux permease